MAAKKAVVSKRVETVKLTCSICGKTQAIGNYYASDREEFVNTSGKAPYCKKCIKSMIVDTNTGNVTIEKFKQALKILNIPFVNSLYVNVANRKGMTNDKFAGAYISAVNLNPDIKNCSFQDSIMFEIKEEQLMNRKIEEVVQKEVTEETKRFWGRGLETQDYIDLQAMFDGYTVNEKSMTKKKQEDYKNLCIYELQKSKIHFDLGRIADTQKLQGLIDNLSSSLGIQAVQKMEDDKNERFTLGLLARYHEDILKRPIRRFVEDLGGIDPIQKKIEVYYKGGILNAMGIQNPEIEKYREEVEQYTVKLKQVEDEIEKERKEVENDG